MKNIKNPQFDEFTGEQLYEYEMKLRGIAQNVLTDRALSYEHFTKMVKEFGRHAPVHLVQNQFIPKMRDGTVHTKFIDKIYDVVIPKGIIDNYKPRQPIYPFGY